MICLENNNWIFSDEYKKMIENMNQIKKNLSPIFDTLCRNNLQLNSILKININPSYLFLQYGHLISVPPLFNSCLYYQINSGFDIADIVFHFLKT